MTRFAQRFVLELEIGAGGMARVFLGRDEVLDRLVAVKVLNPVHGGTEIGDRFRREGRTAAGLSHPNIVSVYDAGEGKFEGREVSYIVMEYVPGGDLKGLLNEKGPLPNAELARLGAGVSSGLVHAHKKGIIHRDIKPHNILIDEYGRPKLTDFGIARALDATEATRTGSYLGTALYSSPEQLQGEKVTPKSDVYSLGVTFYQAAVGEVPFTGTPIEVASQHISRVPIAPTVLGARISGEFEALILDCLHKDLDRRPTAEEVHQRLRKAADATHAQLAPPISRPPEESERTRTAPTGAPPVGLQGGTRREGDRSRRRRVPIPLAVAALLLVTLGAATAFATLGGENNETAQSPPKEEQQASSSEDGGQDASTAGSEESVPAQERTTPGNSLSQQGSDAQASAARAVEEFYTSAAEGDYERSSGLLSANRRQSIFPSRGDFEGQFGTLERVEFTRGPDARVSDGTATVTGQTLAEHTDRTERNEGTWMLVNENGEWKISGWDVNNISYEPA